MIIIINNYNPCCDFPSNIEGKKYIVALNKTIKHLVLTNIGTQSTQMICDGTRNTSKI